MLRVALECRWLCFVFDIDRANLGNHASKDFLFCKLPIRFIASAIVSACR